MKYISFMGDSISTFYGFNPEGYSVFYDEYNAERNSLTSVNDTWWVKVSRFFRAHISVNNSYSGSKVAGAEFPSASSPERTSYLHRKHKYPDIILIYIGLNDFGDGIEITNSKSDNSSFFNAYYNMLKQIKTNYPKSRIICGTLMQGYKKDNPDWEFPQKWEGISIYEYNAAIKIAAQLSGVEVADLAAANIRYETLDGTHPTKDGHITMSKVWISCLTEKVNKSRIREMLKWQKITSENKNATP